MISKISKWVWLGISLTLLNILDLITTLVLLDNHWGREGNPIAAYFLQYGDWTLYIIKAIAIATVFWLAYRAALHKSARRALIVLNIVYFLVVLNNSALLLGVKFPGIFHKQMQCSGYCTK